jgi:DNA invertase Pin-like site-specific DNA recombinase
MAEGKESGNRVSRLRWFALGCLAGVGHVCDWVAREWDRFCHRISLRASPLKSAIPATLQSSPTTPTEAWEIYEERASGKNTIRPELDACLKSLREDDTLVIWRLDRLGRSLGDLIELTNELQSGSIDLESLTEKLDTASPTGKLVFHVFAALPKFERNLIRERTLAGLKAARARGRQGGRPRKLQPKEQKTIRALLKTTEVSVQEIATRFGVSRSTLYRNKLT